jgi:hypothetical protein
VRIDPERKKSIRVFTIPRDTKGVTCFIGMGNFYHKIIPRLADVVAPVNALLKKGVKFVWGKEQQEAVEALKQAISQTPVLSMTDFSNNFILETDASGFSLVGVLSQETDWVRQPIAYAWMTLSAQERKASSTYALECLAVLFSTENLRKYIENKEFILKTDNQDLSWLLSHPRQLGEDKPLGSENSSVENSGATY